MVATALLQSAVVHSDILHGHRCVQPLGGKRVPTGNARRSSNSHASKTNFSATRDIDEDRLAAEAEPGPVRTTCSACVGRLPP